MKPIIIIGTGLAGYTLAKEFRKLDAHTPLTIITQNQGYFYSKPLLSTALTYKRTPNALPVDDAPTMAQKLDATIITETYIEHINVVEKKITASDGKIFHYEKLVFATGAKIIKAPIKGDATDAIFSVNDLEDYALFREKIQHKKHITILGAGLVGCEFANDLINTGHQVDLVALSPFPADRFLPEKVGKTLQTALENEGVKFHLSQPIISIDKKQTRLSVQLPQHAFETDVILSAIGLTPNVHLAIEAGLRVNRGIAVDNHLQSSVPDIYALGDCAEVSGLVLLFVAPIIHCAKALAKTLAGEPTEVQYPIMPVAIKTPSCPIVVCPPSPDIQGSWQIEGESCNMRALFRDKGNQLHGFALSGDMTKERGLLMKELDQWGN